MIFDNQLFSVPPEKENLKEFPTILDVLNEIFFQSKLIMETQGFLPHNHPLNFYCRNRYAPIRSDEKDHYSPMMFMPLSKTAIFFRGQNKYYTPCLSSIDRLNSSEQKFKNRLYVESFKELIFSHPVIRDFFEHGCYVPFEGLAQHYGIPTSWLDITNEPWTAAFFACTEQVNGKYIVYDKEGFGVLYYLDYNDILDIIKPIGLSFFNRPGCQNGFAYYLKEGEDFNNSKFRKLFFKHDTIANNIVFNMNARGERLFPNDDLVTYVNQIKTISEFSQGSVEQVKNKYYKEKSDKEFSKLLEKFSIKIIDKPKISFPTEKLEADWKNWNEYGKKRFWESINNPLFVTEVTVPA